MDTVVFAKKHRTLHAVLSVLMLWHHILFVYNHAKLVDPGKEISVAAGDKDLTKLYGTVIHVGSPP